jgi:hypothetical protein
MNNYNNTNNNKVESKTVIKEFNKTLYDFIKNLSIICPNSNIAKKSWKYKAILTVMKRNTKFLKMFIEHVLIFKTKIDNDDTCFFLEKTYNLDEFEELDEENDSLINELKIIWPSLKKHNQDMVMVYMKLLCKLSQEYFMIEQNLN